MCNAFIWFTGKPHFPLIHMLFSFNEMQNSMVRKRKGSVTVDLLKTLWEENIQGRMLVFTVTADWLLVQMESCFWFCVICGSCLTNTWLIFLLSTLLPVNSCMCWLSGWCAFGFSLNPATPFKQPHTQLFTRSNVPWVIVGNTPLRCYQFTCGWMILNVALLRGSVEGEQTHKTLPATSRSLMH